jgi:threonine synthase
MQFISVNKVSPAVSFREALMNGMAPDGGLYIPEFIPALPENFVNDLCNLDYQTISENIISKYVEEISLADLSTIISRSINFPIPLVKLYDNIFLLELFHGPTLAFKDVGARFMAETLSYFLQLEQKEVKIVVATSGDTGSAVAHGFYNVPNIKVYILYPSTKISKLQEQQMTTLGGNIHAIEVQGTFDDCQRLVKQSLNDTDINRRHTLTTANSINLGRLIPQIAYYLWGVSQLQRLGFSNAPLVVVPSGNFGNITAAVYAKWMGVPINKFIAATNSNNVFQEYINTGNFVPKPSAQTYSNAMDVGHPSNLARLRALYNNDVQSMRGHIKTTSISDEETIDEIRRTYEKRNYILDPHTAVGVAAIEKLKQNKGDSFPIMVTATAHPAKFPEVIKKAISIDIELPVALREAMLKTKLCRRISSNYEDLKEILY